MIDSSYGLVENACLEGRKIENAPFFEGGIFDDPHDQEIDSSISFLLDQDLHLDDGADVRQMSHGGQSLMGVRPCCCSLYCVVLRSSGDLTTEEQPKNMNDCAGEARGHGIRSYGRDEFSVQSAVTST